VWNDNLQVEVIGSLAGLTTYDHTYMLNASATAALAVGTALLTVVTVAAALTTRQPASWRTPDPKVR